MILSRFWDMLGTAKLCTASFSYFFELQIIFPTTTCLSPLQNLKLNSKGKSERGKKKKGRPPAAGSAAPHSPLLWRFGPPGPGEPSGNRN